MPRHATKIAYDAVDHQLTYGVNDAHCFLLWSITTV